MAIVCPVNYEVAQSYKGYNLKTTYNNKKTPVYLKLMCDNTNLKESIDLARGSKNILMVEYQGIDSGDLEIDNSVYVGKIIDFGNDLRIEDVDRLVNSFSDNLVSVIKLPPDFTDLELLYNISLKYPQIRFCGGELFAIAGVKVGVIGVDILDSRGIKFNVDSYYLKGDDYALPVVDIETLEIDTTGKGDVKKKKAKKDGKSQSASSAKKPAKKKMNFGSMMMAMNKS